MANPIKRWLLKRKIKRMETNLIYFMKHYDDTDMLPMREDILNFIIQKNVARLEIYPWTRHG